MSEFNEKSYKGSIALSLLKVKKTQIQMLIDRKIVDISLLPTHILDETYGIGDFLEEFQGGGGFRENISNTYKKLNGDNLLIIYSNTSEKSKTTGNSTIKLIIDRVPEITDGSRNHLIVISELKLSPQAKGIIKNIQYQMKMEHFIYSELETNPSSHFLTPKHEILTDSEVIELYSDHRIQISNIPRIVKDDMMCRYIGACIGKTLKITYDNSFYDSYLKEYIEYRAVVSSVNIDDGEITTDYQEKFEDEFSISEYYDEEF